MYHHVPNKQCLNCGVENPAGVIRVQDNDYIRGDCKDCGQTLFEGVIALDGDPADVPPWVRMPDNEPANMEVGDHVDWHTWELFWNREHTTAALNGVPVAGDAGFYTFISNLLE